ncbi:hypothetical protein N8I77_009842 [Diaporthe amygdali]|uniref:Uncharacterized protein n=1 Tax=Phomopsis amygdali TaxID=1214568 RepID=A0AAD9W138_PHOAM|nr:hypothetical protein N8I77_009842 [Diaporthe amygdali]
MPSITAVIAFMAIALLCTFGIAAPQSKPLRDISTNPFDSSNGRLLDTSPDNSTTNGTASIHTQTCYNYVTSEKWQDMGDSAFVNQAIYDLCNSIAIEAFKGLSKGKTIKRCKEIDSGTNNRDYHRSIGVSLKYKGPSQAFKAITAGYCNDLIDHPRSCPAGGDDDNVRVPNPTLPPPDIADGWQVKGDPNRGSCRENGY